MRPAISRPASRQARSARRTSSPRRTRRFAASDGWINIGGANQANWERIADVLGHPEWRDDPRFATNTARMENLPALVARDERRACARSRAPNGSRCSMPPACRPVPSTRSAKRSTHPQTLARGMVVDLVHPQAGPTKALGCPIHFSATPTRVDRPAPLLGEHTREVLRECGYADDEIDALAADGVVAMPEANG